MIERDLSYKEKEFGYHAPPIMVLSDQNLQEFSCGRVIFRLTGRTEYGIIMIQSMVE
jgi:hypothetical protein